MREALTNAAKHADAKRVEVIVQIDTGHVVLVVTDDGVGIDDEGSGRRSGVANISARAQDLGGSCRIERVSESRRHPPHLARAARRRLAVLVLH